MGATPVGLGVGVTPHGMMAMNMATPTPGTCYHGYLVTMVTMVTQYFTMATPTPGICPSLEQHVEFQIGSDLLKVIFYFLDSF